MIHVAFCFCGNMRFGYLPSEDAIAERGYVPLFETFAEFPELRADLTWSGYRELTLAARYPKVVDLVKQGMQQGRLRISTNGFEHIPLPFVSHEVARKCLALGLETDRRVWGDEVRPDGFFASDCAFDPAMGVVLRELGVRWTILGFPSLRESAPGGMYPAAKDYDDLVPIDVLCTP